MDGLTEDVTVRRRAISGKGGGRETALETWIGVQRKVEFDDLADSAGVDLAGLLRVEVEQEPPQALTSAPLGGAVVLHPDAALPG